MSNNAKKEEYANSNKKNGYNKRSNNKGGKRNSTPKGSAASGSRSNEEFGKYNDIRWWFKDDKLLNSVLSLPNTGVSGIPLDFGNNFKFEMPGILALHTVHGIPASFEANKGNAVNTAATRLFQDITRRNSRPPTTYNKQDLFLYYLAMNEANAFLTYCCRAYGSMLYWRFRNKYVPIKLFEAMGLNWETFRTREMEFYKFLTEFATMAASLPVPRVFDFYNRSKYLYSDTYSDGASSKAQIYLNVPALFRVYDPTYSSSGGGLKAVPWATGHTGEELKTLDDLKEMGWNILEPLINDEDIAIMGSDILRAYTPEECFSWEICPIDYVQAPLPSNYLYLLQVHNANINYFIDPADTDMMKSFDVSTSANYNTVIYMPTIHLASTPRPDYEQVWNNTAQVCDFKGDDITPEMWFYATMWKSLPTVMDQDTDTYVIYWDLDKNGEMMRTELICGATMYVGEDRLRLWQFMEIKDDTYPDRYGRLALLQNFDWHPMIMTFKSNGDAVEWVQPFFEMENYSDITRQSIQNINRAAMYGIWGLTDSRSEQGV